MSRARFPYFPRSLSGNLVAVVLLVTGAVMAVQAMVHIVRIRAQDRAVAEERLLAIADRYAGGIAGALGQMTDEAGSISGFPPFQGIIRSIGTPDRIDPADGSTLEDWRARLETIFASELRRRPSYTQMRFIGRAGNWREIVRVDQVAGRIFAVPLPELQEKGAEPYLQEAGALRPGESYFSEVTLNREHGRISGAPTIRLVHPVFDAAGELFGVFVINADFAGLLGSADVALSPGVRLDVLTGQMDHMHFAAGADPELAFHTDPDRPVPALAGLIATPGAEAHLTFRDGTAAVLRTIAEPGGGRPFALYAVTSTDTADLYAASRSAAAQEFLIAAAVVACALALVAAVGRRLVRPLVTLRDQIATRHDPLQPLTLDFAGGDEVAELARAFVDITNELIETSARTAAIFNGVGNAIVVIGEDSVIEDVNPAAEHLFDYPRAALVGMDLSRLMPAEIARQHGQLVRRHGDAEGRMARNREVEAVTRDGRVVPVEVFISSAVSNGRKRIIGVINDITERRAAEQRMAELIAALERSNSELDQFAYVASHDLKAPLRVIDNASRWLAEDLDEVLTDDTRETLEFLRSRVTRMERLLNDLLEHSRIGRHQHAAHTVSGAELLEDLRSLLDLPAEFELAVSPQFSAILVENMPLKVVLLNLLSNAIRHNDKPRGRAELDVVARPDAYEFTISDNGPGIPPSYHDRIFDLFQTLKPRDEVDTSGMGLATVRKYVQLVGGRIAVDSDGQEGTRFHLTWPRRPAEQAEAAEQRKAS